MSFFVGIIILVLLRFLVKVWEDDSTCRCSSLLFRLFILSGILLLLLLTRRNDSLLELWCFFRLSLDVALVLIEFELVLPKHVFLFLELRVLRCIGRRVFLNRLVWLVFLFFGLTFSFLGVLSFDNFF